MLHADSLSAFRGRDLQRIVLSYPRHLRRSSLESLKVGLNSFPKCCNDVVPCLPLVGRADLLHMAGTGSNYPQR